MAAVVRLHEQVIASLRSAISKQPHPRFRDVAVQQRGEKSDVAKSEARALLPLIPGGLTVVGVAVRGEFTLENQALIREPIAEFRRIFHDVALARRPFIVTWTSDALASGEIPPRISILAGIELRRGDVAVDDWWGQDITENTWKCEEREQIEGDEEDGGEEGTRDDKQTGECEADVAWEIKAEEESENADVEVEVVEGEGGKRDGATGGASGAAGENNRLEEEFWAAHCPLVCDVAAALPLYTHDKQSLSSSISASLSAIQADVISPHALWLLHPPQPPSAATSAAASSASATSAAAGAARPILIGSLPNGRASAANGSVTRGKDSGGTAEEMVCAPTLLLCPLLPAHFLPSSPPNPPNDSPAFLFPSFLLCLGLVICVLAHSLQLASATRVSLLLNQSPPATSASAGQNSAPIGLSYTPAAPSIHLHQISLSLSTLVFAPQHLSPRAAVRRLVVPGLLRQVKAIEWMVGGRGEERQKGEGGKGGEEGGKREKRAGARSADGRGAAEDAASAVSFQLGLKFGAYHLLLPSFPHPLTVIYPLTYGEGQQSLVDMRLTLHHRLGLPLDRPMLRIASSLSFSAPTAAPDANQASSKGLRLWDVHVGLPRLPHSAGSKQYLVQGSYEYYHYMQDRIDDSGWGCAYRSLQTIVSWFRIQQYTSVPVPTHRRIQEALVEIGDKEAAFVGSSQWIGAIELSFILDLLLGVTCKVLTVSSGADMPSKGRQLAHHFSTQGTPVMIGGGVLAYTLLGVDYDEATGECAFLILDPHYTGGEDLKAIRSGGWVAWRKAKTDGGADFFVRDAFYNLLLPQRPATV
ncbi:unnamed protein product [Closterium sp. Yama58-4]|nr:unnamed protein product [Closterium sp. Yama58-4]